MPSAKPIPVALDVQTIARLDAAAERLHIKRTQVIRVCVMSFLDYLDTHNVEKSIEGWRKTIGDTDGRRIRFHPELSRPLMAAEPSAEYTVKPKNGNHHTKPSGSTEKTP